MLTDLELGRLTIGPEAFLTLAGAIDKIPVGTRKQRNDWLFEQGLVEYLFGRPVVRWSRVLDAAFPPRGQRPESRPRSTGTALPRVRL